MLENKIKLNNKTSLDLGRLGVRLAQEYSTRFDMLSIQKCLYLRKFKSSHIKKEERHLLQLIPKFAPLFSLMEYYDNYPFSYSDINYRFKGCLKTGVEICIKVSNNPAKENFIKKLIKLQKRLKYILFFYPFLEKKYKIKEILTLIEKKSYDKYDFKKEINSTRILKKYLSKCEEELNLYNIKFPKIYAYLSDENTIVSKHIYGSYFYELLEQNEITYNDALTIVKSQLFFILKCNIYYNNLYSGNLMKSEDGTIHYLDCNNLGSLKQETSLQLLRLFKALILGNYPYVANILNELSTQSLNTLDLEELEYAIKNIFNTNKKEYLEVFFIKIMKIFRCASKLGMRFDEEIFPLFKSLVYLDLLLFKTIDKNTKIKTDILNILNDLEKLKITTID